MFQVLVESAAPRAARHGGWAMGSATIHAGLVTAAVILTTRVGPAGLPPTEPVVPPIYVPAPVVPPEPVASTPAEGGTRVFPGPVRVDIRVPGIPTFDPAIPVSPHVSGGVDPFTPRGGGGITPLDGNPTPSMGIHTAGVVDRMVLPSPRNPAPDYPPALRAAGIEGDVLVSFVVDTAGRVEPGSITITAATHALFAESVRRWLPRTRYAPAEIRGRTVRQLVQQRVEFTLRTRR